MATRIKNYIPDHNLRSLIRRIGWIVNERTTPRRLANLAVASTEYALRREHLRCWPTVLKIDISPACNLRCVSCLHADAAFAPDDSSMNDIQFQSSQKMSTQQFQQLITEVKDHTSAVSLYYYGDPYAHPNVDAMCRITSEAGLNSHISTNFSFAFSDARIRSIVKSGLTHLTVCVDGLSQDVYTKTRVGGNIERVLNNLERLCAYRNEAGQRWPQVEVQYVRFRHNQHEYERAKDFFESLGVDQVATFAGSLHSISESSVQAYTTGEPFEQTVLARCKWPWVYMLIKYDGEVIPCCNHRGIDQYRADSSVDPRTIGNVFKDGVRAVWNSDFYRQNRRLVASPDRLKQQPHLKGAFCYGCSKLFATDKASKVRDGDHWDFEQVYPHLAQQKLVQIGR